MNEHKCINCKAILRLVDRYYKKKDTKLVNDKVVMECPNNLCKVITITVEME